MRGGGGTCRCHDAVDINPSSSLLFLREILIYSRYARGTRAIFHQKCTEQKQGRSQRRATVCPQHFSRRRLLRRRSVNRLGTQIFLPKEGAFDICMQILSRLSYTNAIPRRWWIPRGEKSRGDHQHAAADYMKKKKSNKNIWPPPPSLDVRSVKISASASSSLILQVRLLKVPCIYLKHLRAGFSSFSWLRH